MAKKKTKEVLDSFKIPQLLQYVPTERQVNISLPVASLTADE